jgi:hypothetical protein
VAATRGSGLDRRVGRHDGVAVIARGVTVDQHDRHRRMPPTVKRLDS